MNLYVCSAKNVQKILGLATRPQFGLLCNTQKINSVQEILNIQQLINLWAISSLFYSFSNTSGLPKVINQKQRPPLYTFPVMERAPWKRSMHRSHNQPFGLHGAIALFKRKRASGWLQPLKNSKTSEIFRWQLN